MELTLFNEIGIPVDIEINILGEHRNSDTGVLEKSQTLDPILVHLNLGAIGSPASTTVILNSSNSQSQKYFLNSSGRLFFDCRFIVSYIFHCNLYGFSFLIYVIYGLFRFFNVLSEHSVL